MDGMLPNEHSAEFLKNATREVRMAFIRKVYSVLTVQLMIAILIAAPISRLPDSAVWCHLWILYSVAVTAIVMMCGMLCCVHVARFFPMNCIFLCVFTVIQGVLIGLLSALFTWESVELAVVVTLAIFFAMSLFAWTSNTDFTGWVPYVFASVMALCAFGVLLMLIQVMGIAIRWLYVLVDVCCVLAFTFYVVFDTQLLIGERGGHLYQIEVDDHVFAALSLYLDLLKVHVYVLALLGSRR